MSTLFPIEIETLILSFLPIQLAIVYSCVCKRWKFILINKLKITWKDLQLLKYNEKHPGIYAINIGCSDEIIILLIQNFEPSYHLWTCCIENEKLEILKYMCIRRDFERTNPGKVYVKTRNKEIIWLLVRNNLLEYIYFLNDITKEGNVELLKEFFPNTHDCAQKLYDIAIRYNHLDVIKLLYSKNILLPDNFCEMAMKYNRFEMVIWARDRRAKINDNVFIEAIKNNNLKAIKQLHFYYGFDIRQSHIALCNSKLHKDVIEFLKKYYTN